MTREELQTELTNIGIDYETEMARIVVPANATKDQFDAAEKMRRAIRSQYAIRSINAQKQAGITTPVAFGMTESDLC